MSLLIIPRNFIQPSVMETETVHPARSAAALLRAFRLTIHGQHERHHPLETTRRFQIAALQIRLRVRVVEPDSVTCSGLALSVPRAADITPVYMTRVT